MSKLDKKSKRGGVVIDLPESFDSVNDHQNEPSQNTNGSLQEPLGSAGSAVGSQSSDDDWENCGPINTDDERTNRNLGSQQDPDISGPLVENFKCHAVSAPSSDEKFSNPTFVLAILSMLQQSKFFDELKKPVESSSHKGDSRKSFAKSPVSGGGCSKEKSFCEGSIKSVIQSILKFIGIKTDDKQLLSVLNLLNVKGDDIVSLSFIIQMSGTSLVLSEKTQNIIESGCFRPDQGDVSDMEVVESVESTRPKKVFNLEYVIKVLESYTDSSTRFDLFIQLLDRFPFEVEEKSLDINRMLMNILFDFNNGTLFDSTKSAKVLFDNAIALLKETKILISQKASIMVPIPNPIDDGGHVRRKEYEAIWISSQLKEELQSRINSLLLMVIVIFRQFPIETPLSKESREIFFELVNFIEKNNLPEYFKGLCFDQERHLQNAYSAIKNDASCVEHKSRVLGAGSGQIDFMDLYEDVFRRNENKLVTMFHGVGSGKTTVAFSTAAIHAALNGFGFVFYCGPEHCANITDINLMSQAISEFLQKNQVNVKVVPVFNGIVPKQIEKQRTLYVVVGNTINHIFTLMPRFVKDKFHVIIDDNNHVSSSEVMNLLKMENSGRIFVLGATMKMSFPESVPVLKLGEDSDDEIKEIRTVEGQGCISHVPLSMKQIISGFNHINDATEFISDPEKVELLVNLRKVMNILFDISSKDILSEEMATEMMRHIQDSLKKLHRFIPVNFESINCSTENFFNTFIVFIKIVSKFLKKPTIFPLEVDRLFNEVIQELELNQMESLSLSLMNLEKSIKNYVEIMMRFFASDNTVLKCFPQITDCLHSQHKVETLSSDVKKIFQRIFDAGLMFSSDLIMPPRPVPEDERNYRCVSPSTIFIVGEGANVGQIARKISDKSLESNRKLISLDEKENIDETRDHQSRSKKPNGTLDKTSSLATNASSLSSPKQCQAAQLGGGAKKIVVSPNLKQSSKNDGFSIEKPTLDYANEADYSDESDMTSREKNDEINLDAMMKHANSIKKHLRSNAPVPSTKDINSFSTILLSLKPPIWKEILRNFVLGVVVLDYEMPHEMILLCLELFSQGLLCLIVQEGRFDLMSMNLQYKGNLRLIFLSEVSSSFFRQIIGRCGRVSSGNQSFGIVECMTPSGVIVLPETEERKISDDLSHNMGSLDDFYNRFQKIQPRALVREIYGFFSSCRLNEKEINFFMNLLTLFQEVLYNNAFKFCCSENNVERIMAFLSCALIVLSGNSLPLCRENIDKHLTGLALNSVSKAFSYERKTFEEIERKFVEAVKKLITCENLSSAFGFLRIIDEGRFRWLNDADLSRMFFQFRELSKLSDLMRRFLFNIQTGKSSPDFNRSINVLLTMLKSFDDVLDRFMGMIMSSSINSDIFYRVKDDRTHSQRVIAPTISPEQLFSELMAELHYEHLSIDYVRECLDKYSKSGCMRCVSILYSFNNIFRNRISIFLDSLKKELSECTSSIRDLQLKLKPIEEKIEKNRLSLKGLILTKANAALVREKNSLLSVLEKENTRRKHIEYQSSNLEKEIAPYLGLIEQDAVQLFIRKINQ